MNTEPNTVDELMNHLSLSQEYDRVCDMDPGLAAPRDINVVIAYHRKSRANRAEGGARPKRDTGPKLTLDLEALGLKKPKAQVKITRRV